MSIKVLHINSHPLFTNEKHATVQLAQHGIKALADKEGIENQVINLYDGDFFLPKVDNILLSQASKYKRALFTVQVVYSEYGIFLLYSPCIGEMGYKRTINNSPSVVFMLFFIL